MEEISAITIASRNGIPVHVRDVAEVRINSLTRYGAVSADGKGEVVTGLVLLREGANSRTTVEGAKQALELLNAALPKGIVIIPFYVRTEPVYVPGWTVE